MPQPRRDAVHRYFQYNSSTNISKCELCGVFLKGKHATNLKNHVIVKHWAEYLVIQNINRELVQSRPSASRDRSVLEIVKKNCVKLVSVHGRPFALIHDKAFQEIINIAVPSNAEKKHININSIKKMIPEKAYEIKHKIAAEIRNTLISLKLDSASYLDRNFLGINLQYIKGGKIIVRNLAVLEVFERQTGEFLKEKVLEVLNDFQISTAQIYSVTTDNGTNFKKMTKLFTEYCSTTTNIYETRINSKTEIHKDDHEDDDEDDDEDADEDDYVKQSFENVELDVETFINTIQCESFKPRVMFCAAHTMQLAVKDAIANSLPVQICIEVARKAVKILRRPSMKNIIKLSNLNKPLIDCPTRWTSTYQMLVRLVSLKEICVGHPDITAIFSEDFWEQIVNIINCLKPVNEATLALQREQLTIGDFYIEWLNCKAKVELIQASFAHELRKCMEERERNLLNTDLVLENLYLDGRLNVVLSERECVKAQLLICDTLKQLQSVTSEMLDSTYDVSTSSQHDVREIASTSEQSIRMSELEKLLKETEAVRGLSGRNSLDTFEAILLKLRYKPRLPLNENILTHWANKEPTNNVSLISVANCILAAPATQVSVERLFSSVKFILNPLRGNISGNLLQDIMLIRCNPDLLN